MSKKHTVMHPITGARIEVEVGNDESCRQGGKEFEEAYSEIKRGAKWPNPSAEGLVLLDEAIDRLKVTIYSGSQATGVDNYMALVEINDLLTDYREGISND